MVYENPLFYYDVDVNRLKYDPIDGRIYCSGRHSVSDIMQNVRLKRLVIPDELLYVLRGESKGLQYNLDDFLELDYHYLRKCYRDEFLDKGWSLAVARRDDTVKELGRPDPNDDEVRYWKVLYK